MNPPGIIASLLPAVDSILGVRDAVGAVIDPVYFVTRTWFKDVGCTIPASSPGGYARDSKVQMLPSPALKNYSQNVRLVEGGTVKAGDIILKNVSRNKFSESDLDGTSTKPNVEKLFLVGEKLYQVINVKKDYVTWDVQVRELSAQQRYGI